MSELLPNFFNASSFMPHGYCYLWKPGLVGLHVISDSLITLAYFSIPITLVYIVYKRGDLPFDWLFFLFGSFIILCGITHAMEVWTLWHPFYWVSGIAKAATAGVSMTTAGLLVPLVPKILAIPSPQQLEEANLKLEAQILERQGMEEDLLSSQQMLRLVMDNIPQKIFWKDHDSVYLGCNRSFAQAAGVKETEEIVGLTDYDLPWKAEQAKAYCADDQEVMEADKPKTNIVEPQQQADGEERWLNTNKIPLHDSKGNVVGILGTVEDITERKLAQEQLQRLNEELEERVEDRTDQLKHLIQQLRKEIEERQQAETARAESEQKFRSIVANVPGAIYRSRCDRDWTMIFISDAIADISGYPTSDFINNSVRSFASIIAPEDSARLEKAVLHAIEKRQPYIVEYSLQRADGSLRWMYEKGQGIFNEKDELLWLDGVIFDITERKEAEAARQKSEEQLKAILDNAPAAIYLKDAEGRFLVINRICARLFGATPEEIEGKSLYKILPYEVAEKFHNADLEVLKAGTSQELEETLPQEDGLHTFLSVKFPLYDAQGQPYAVCGISTDITERKKAQEEQQKLIALIENSSDFIGLADLDGQALYVNEAGQKLVGIEGKEQYRQLQVPQFFLPEDRQEFQESILPVIMSKGRWEGEFRFRNFQIEAGIPIFLNAFTVKNEETGEPIAIATVSRDITERKKAEVKLRTSQAKYKELATREGLLNRLAGKIRSTLDLNNILETAVSGIYDLLHLDRCLFIRYDAEIDPPVWKVIQQVKNPILSCQIGERFSANNGLGLLAGTTFEQNLLKIDQVKENPETQEDKIALSLGYRAILMLPIQTQYGVKGVLSCIQHHESRHWTDGEVELLRGVTDQLAIAIDQAELYKQSRTTARIAETKAQELQKALRELQLAQSQLLQSEKMASLGQMVAGVAHEINNPVNFIYGNLTHTSEYIEDLLGLIDLYQESYPEPTPEIRNEIEIIELDFLLEDLPKAISSMKVGTERIREIVKSLRTFSRLDEAEMKDVDIHDGIESTLLILQNRLKAKSDQVEIEVMREYGELPKIECYAGQLNQVFMNLLSNGIDAIEEVRKENPDYPPKITIITNVVDSGGITIRIVDNGSGIPEEKITHIFDPFYTTKAVGKGTGLGLSISYQIIVDKHGGTLECHSSPGEGTEFIIHLPLKPNPSFNNN